MRGKPELNTNESSFVGIFASDVGIKAIDSPVKVNILEMLKAGELPFEEIVARSGRAKSTVSVHLRDLFESGIISSRSDPGDARKKLFSLYSSYLVGATVADRDMFRAKHHFPAYESSENNTGAFFRFILSTIRITLLSEGISIDPLLYSAGTRVGRRIHDTVQDTTTSVLLDNIAGFWDLHNLGQVEIEKEDPLTLKFFDCFECRDFPTIGKPVCAFESGVISSIFSDHFGSFHHAIETNCYAMGDEYCRFEIFRGQPSAR